MIESPPEIALPEKLPVLPLREFVVFPYMTLPLFVARGASVAAVEDALAANRIILLVAQRDPETTEPEPDDLYRVGTAAMILRSMRMADGRLKLLVQGLCRTKIDSFIDSDTTVWVRPTGMCGDDETDWSVEAEALVRAVRGRVEELLPLKNLPPEVLSVITNVEKPGRLADLIASNLRLRLGEAQEILEIQDCLARLRRVDALLRRELDVTTMQAEIQCQAKEELSRGQREIFLREQLRAIQGELGETDPRTDELDEYRIKIEDAMLSSECRDETLRQLRRLERMHPDGPEAQVVRNYLDWIVELPWGTTSPDRLDLPHARTILDQDHAHLDQVKDRILEFLGVRKLRSDSRGPILCFSGPPGVGKTSLGRSIARCMGREFVRISLGGVRDEAEIRGHRRTYVGAMPGRIVQGLKQAGTNNPVFMLDEIDKVGADFRGDPSAALLEVLDPEQNGSFSDHFLGVPFDLSKVLFIATANLLDPIPPPLRDRMEVIQLSGYTPEEKVEIATKFLIPRQVEENGLAPEQISWSRNAIGKLTAEYTYEAGVRGLERQIAAVSRKVARRAAEGDTAKVSISQRNLFSYLGQPPYQSEPPRGENEVGVVNGLAWTVAGGDVLVLEASLARGRGLVLTGQLGDVMKESGQAAFSYARSALREMDIDDSVLSRNEIHVHVPAGATPKDGPSAGVSIATAIVSLATGIPVRSDIAMTGEITLRGKVLAVGGVRDKALAALRSEIKTVIVPKACLRDLDEIPKELKKRMNFVAAASMREILDVALERPPVWRTAGLAEPTTTSRSAHATPPATLRKKD
jgi:ATP-dependent Lon protease